MPDAWQVLAAVTASLALAAWFAWTRMREARDEWVSAWHYWPSRAAETRASYDRWRHAVAVAVVVVVASAVATGVAYLRRDPARPAPTGAATGAQATATPGVARPAR